MQVRRSVRSAGFRIFYFLVCPPLVSSVKTNEGLGMYLAFQAFLENPRRKSGFLARCYTFPMLSFYFRLFWGLFLPTALLCLCGTASATSTVPLDSHGRELFLDGQVAVEFQPDISPERQETIAKDLGYTILKKATNIHTMVLQVPNGKVLDYVETLKQYSWFKRVYPNYRVHLFYSPYSYPNDPNYQDGNGEWNVNQVKMDAAWNDPDPWIATASRGRPSAKIGIVDTGIRTTHEEFAGKIDLAGSWNFVENNNIIVDLDGHGTHMAGIATVNTNNTKGGGHVCRLFSTYHGNVS